ncbi:unnamed protein product [Mytilus edulis]|uniref:Uncharacterized protein n=1 Tax=Mytilus edulis TaxID=6550 RepID=A0A8S3UQG4_MYTED|nr:unnamed protein product [Mytilus edulis]
MKNFLKFKTGENSPDLRKFGEEYYLREAKLWRPFRIGGIASIGLALPFSMGSIFNAYWLYGEGFNAGMWDSCYQPLNFTVRMCPEKRPHWQNAVIGLMIFAASIGFLAAILAVLGVCTSPLPKKIYYFHSAGEIFLVCAMAATIALVIYPAGIEMDKSIASHYYGSGYGLGWGSAFFFLCAALCMSLDDLVRESAKAKCCRLCFKRDRSDTESQQV